MALNCVANKNCLFTQFFAAFGGLVLLSYLSCCFGCLVSFVGQLLVLLGLSWRLTKRIRKRLNKEVITSYKRAVVVTGCDSGFGNALAFKLNENGYRVYATVLNPDSDGAKNLLTGSRFDGMTHILKMDVTDEEEVQKTYDYIKNDLRQKGEELWGVVNNAGIITYGPFDWGTIDTYKQVFDVNTFGMVRVTRAFLPLLRQSKGRVVNLVSLAGRRTPTLLPIYSMSKHAAISFSDAIRRELRKYGIKVSTVEPTAYKTQMASNDFIEGQIGKLWAETSDDVKEVYGEDYYHDFRKKKEKLVSMLSPGDNIYEVVDLLVEALRSPDPQIRYVAIPGGGRRKAMIALSAVLPTEIYDIIIARHERSGLQPAILRNEE